VTEEQPFDEKIETPGGTFYVDGASILYLIGSTMDWREDDFAAGFVFDNPNAKGACGCGESFTVCRVRQAAAMTARKAIRPDQRLAASPRSDRRRPGAAASAIR
jgi:hypothetical protein